VQRSFSRTSVKAETTNKVAHDIGELAGEMDKGGRAAVDRLFPLLYLELKRIARRQRRGERPNHSLNTTGLGFARRRAWHPRRLVRGCAKWLRRMTSRRCVSSKAGCSRSRRVVPIVRAASVTSASSSASASPIVNVSPPRRSAANT
jgi:hypothetical protein